MKIKVAFVIPKKDFSHYEYVHLMVESSLKDGMSLSQDVEWRVKIPDFMFEELADTEPQFKTTHGINNRNISGCFSRNTLQKKFKKTQVSTSIEVLFSYISGLTRIILNRHSVDTQTKKKKIFVKFNKKEQHKRFDRNGGYMGLEVSQSFVYFIGYESMSKSYSDSLHEEVKLKKVYYVKSEYGVQGTMRSGRVIDNFVEKDYLEHLLLDPNVIESEYIVIDWTQEREDFFEKIKKSIIELGIKVNAFFEKINNENVDLVIKNSSGFDKLLSE